MTRDEMFIIFDQIRNTNDITEKELLMHEVLGKSKFIFEESLLMQNDDSKWGEEKNSLLKFLEYRKTKGHYKQMDCDVSLAAVVTYKLMYSFLNNKKISAQKANRSKYEFLIEDGTVYRGDTLTSAITTIKRYLGFLWKEIDKSDELKENIKYSDFYDLFEKVSAKGIPCAKEGTWDSYCATPEHANIIWNAMDNEARLFLDNYMRMGNYICIPGNTYAVTAKIFVSFNTARSNMGKWDTVDTLLWKIYQGFKENNIEYIEKIFTVKSKELAKGFQKCNKDFSITSWDDFIKVHCLQDFIEDGKPISLKSGKPIELDIRDEYDAMPNSYDESVVFFKTLSDLIGYRSKRIWSLVGGKGHRINI